MLYVFSVILLGLAIAVAFLVPRASRFSKALVITPIMKNKKLKPIHLPTLGLYAKDLSLMASRGELDPVVGRDREIQRVIQILSRRTKNNPILVGKAGVGKTAIVEGLAQTLLSNIWQENLSQKRVLSLDLPSLLAGTKFRGEFEKRLKNVANEIIAAKRNIILFIDEIHTLAGAGEATGGIGAADILKPALARGDLQVVGATTPHEYTSIIKKDTTLSRRFQPVMVKEPTQQETVVILQALKPRYGSYHGVRISDAAIRKAVDISMGIKGRQQPDKAIDLMDETASYKKLRLRIEPTHHGVVPEVSALDVESVFHDWVKVVA